MLTAENDRLPSATKPVAERTAAHVRWLEEEPERTERDLDAAIKSSPALRENEALLRRVPAGVGPVLARALLSAEVPEPGTLTHEPLAAVVGVAPLDRDSSGTFRGRRGVCGVAVPTRPSGGVRGRCGRYTPRSGC